jgi:hypothetical protein
VIAVPLTLAITSVGDVWAAGSVIAGAGTVAAPGVLGASAKAMPAWKHDRIKTVRSEAGTIIFNSFISSSP